MPREPGGRTVRDSRPNSNRVSHAPVDPGHGNSVSAMYLQHFGLDAPPFRITPDTQLFFNGARRGPVLEALLYAINNGEAIIKVVGEVGSGKTMLCRMLAEKLPANIDCVYLVNPRLTSDTILLAIALELQLPIASQAENQNRLQVLHALHQTLLEKHAAGRQVVVLIEEAQSMPLDTLEEIRLLSNLETGQHKLLQIVLFGQPELDENLARRHIRQLRERITHGFYVSPLKPGEIGEYLEFRMRAAGYRGPSLFSRGAIASLGRASAGLPRRINILADKALLAAFAENTHFIKRRHVRRAARDSGFNGGRAFSPWLLAGLLLCLLLAAGWLSWRNSDYFGFLSSPPVSRAELPLQPAPGSGQNSPGADLPANPLPPPLVATSENTSPPLPPESPPEQTSPTPWLAARLAAGQQWLAETGEQEYSIQVMQRLGEKPADLERWLRQKKLQPFLPKLYVFQGENQKGQLWGVFYGQFPDYDQAGRALKTLPEALRENKPFLRKIGSIRDKFT